MPRRFHSLNKIEEQEQLQVLDQWQETQRVNLENQRDAANLCALVLRQIAKPTLTPNRVVIVGVPQRTTWPPGNHDHVPIALEQLQGMGLKASALPVCAPLDPLLVKYAKSSWMRTFRQCIVVTLP